MTPYMLVSLMLVTLLVQFCKNEHKYCPEAVSSSVSVDACPTTKDEWDSAVIRKNCTNLAVLQNCTTDKENFLYHCVINEYRNETLEVCAPRRLITGDCTEFSVEGGIIQIHYTSHCNETMFPKCNQYYLSSDAYNYPACYELAYKRRAFSSTTIPPQETTTLSNPDHRKTTIIAVPSAIFICGVLATFAFCLRRRRPCSSAEVRITRDKKIEEEELENILPSTDRRKCEIEDYDKAIEKGKLLLSNVNGKNDSERKYKVEDDTNAFFGTYDNLMESYVETNLTRESKNKLKKDRMLILTGVQGTGKTLTAIYIMNKYYKKWKKLKFTSYEDLLCFDLGPKSFIYIDNFLDGFMYRHSLKDWWNSLCYFYSMYIEKRTDVCLLITAKEDVIENACANIKVNISFLAKSLIVKAEMFDLDFNEKKAILDKHCELAKLNKPFYSEQLKTCMNDFTATIGFPFCAFLYAFEDAPAKRDVSIFNDTETYIRIKIDWEIKNDESKGVKTLLLILLFYHSPPGMNYVLDLKYKEECIAFLESESLRELKEQMGPFNTANLHEIANKLQKKFLLKHLTMHRVYLDGVRDYFIREYFDAAVQHFPLDMLRTYKFHLSTHNLKQLIERFKTELHNGNISETLCCKIFEDNQFEVEFCKHLQKDMIKKIINIPDKASTFKLQIIFWAHKNRLKTLSKKLWEYVKENEIFHFYLARFGECCEEDDSYISKIDGLPTVEKLQTCVFNFRTREKKNILHMVVSSDKSDYDAHCCLKKIVKESPQDAIYIDTDLLILALNHAGCSRLSCILEILNRLNERSTTCNRNILCKVDSKMEAFWNFEWVVRICIVSAYNEIQPEIANIKFQTSSRDHERWEKLLDMGMKQEEMALYIKSCFEEYNHLTLNTSWDSLKKEKRSFRNGIKQELKDALTKAIRIQSLYK